MLDSAAARVDRLRPLAGGLERRAAATPPPRPFATVAPAETVGVIAELKRRSPSAGPIHQTLDLVGHARAYAAGGAVAISVLTETQHFGGSLDDLERVSAAVPLPVLRKDFIVDELQLLEARIAGAAAVLLIARVLPPVRLRALLVEAHRLGLAAVVEVHASEELDAARRAEARIVGVNSRNLDDFTIDRAAAERLLRRVPADVLAVGESGIESRADVERLAAAGADLVLVGTSLARLADPRAAVRALTGVPRRSRGVAA
jgi:indole-3-glycerol phosphate synthase